MSVVLSPTNALPVVCWVNALPKSKCIKRMPTCHAIGQVCLSDSSLRSQGGQGMKFSERSEEVPHPSRGENF